MAIKSHRPGDWWANLLAEIFVRIGYAIVTAILLFYVGRRILLHASGPGPWILLGIISLLVALFGPSVHKNDMERGRGRLAEIKHRSKKR